jgi:hypothetical protein
MEPQGSLTGNGPVRRVRVRVREKFECALLFAGFEVGGRRHDPKNAGSLQKLERASFRMLL